MQKYWKSIVYLCINALCSVALNAMQGLVTIHEPTFIILHAVSTKRLYTDNKYYDDKPLHLTLKTSAFVHRLELCEQSSRLLSLPEQLKLPSNIPSLPEHGGLEIIVFASKVS